MASPVSEHRGGHLSEIRVGRTAVVAAALTTASVVLVAATPQLLGNRLGQAFAGLDRARLPWVGVAALSLLCSLLAMAGAWHVALRACRARLSFGDTCARYATGSLVNTFAPLRLGDAVRVALFARLIPSRNRIWRAGGGLVAIEAVRGIMIGSLVCLAWFLGATPPWPVVGLMALVLPAIVTAILFGPQGRAGKRLGQILLAGRRLARAPRRAALLTACVALATVSRVLAAISVCLALKITAPVAAGLFVVVALELGGLLPLTPGNVGLTSGTVAIALASRGVSLNEALTVGLALQAVETAAGLSFGVAGALQLATVSRPVLRRWTPVVASVLVTLSVAALVGLSIVDDLT